MICETHNVHKVRAEILSSLNHIDWPHNVLGLGGFNSKTYTLISGLIHGLSSSHQLESVRGL
jgi:hypothetical protein